MPSESCLKWDHKVKTTSGELDFHEICEANNINWEDVENTDAVGWYDLENPITVPTLDGDKEVSKLYYNGNKPLVSIHLEDGNVFKCTATHKFLVKLEDGTTEWKLAACLEEDDDIVEF
jgi:intein/homing endonuclease